MGLEIDMLDVSNGDAIIIREVNPSTGQEWVGVIDGGQTDGGRRQGRPARPSAHDAEVDRCRDLHPP